MRRGVRCPHCLSLERTRLLRFFLEKEIFSGGKGPVTLHFAPEKSIETYVEKKSELYVSADIDPHVASHVVDITKMPFKDAYFDLIICSHVLAHVYDESKAIDEINRVLKPNGRAIILTHIYDLKDTIERLDAASPELKQKYLGQDDIWRKHGEDFEDRLRRPNIYVEKIDYRKMLTEEDCAQYVLGTRSSEIFYIMHKKSQS